jgi:hypothetical protein
MWRALALPEYGVGLHLHGGWVRAEVSALDGAGGRATCVRLNPPISGGRWPG